MTKRQVTYPKSLTARNLNSLKGMKLIYTGDSKGPLSGKVVRVEKWYNGDTKHLSATLDLEIDWIDGMKTHTDLTFLKLISISKDKIISASYKDITFYPNGYPKADCSLCRSKCKAIYPCGLYDTLLKGG